MEKRKFTGFKLPPDLLDRLDEAREKFDFPPTRTDVVERALEDWLKKQADAKKRKGPVVTSNYQ